MSEEPRNTGILIRPMGIGEVLDAGFSLGRNNFRLLVTIAAWGVIPGQALSAIVALVLTSMGEVSITESLSVASVMSSVLASLGQAMAVFAIQMATSKLIDPDVSAVPLRPWPLYRASIGRMLLWALFILALIIPAVLLMVLFPLGIYLAVRWSMLFIPFVSERLGPIASMKRSWAVTRGAWWHTAAVLVITGVVMSVLEGAVGAVLGVGSLVAGGLAGGGLSAFLSVLATSVAGVLCAPFSVSIYTVLYYELRARNEGFDLTRRAHQLLTPNQ